MLLSGEQYGPVSSVGTELNLKKKAHDVKSTRVGGRNTIIRGDPVTRRSMTSTVGNDTGSIPLEHGCE
jgi:hypothetical protein